MGTNLSSYFDPKMATTLCLSETGLRLNRSLPLLWSLKLTSGCAMATLWNSSMMWRISTWSDFKKLRLAGTLKNKFLIANWVPSGQATGETSPVSLPLNTTFVPISEPTSLVLSSTWATAAIDARASPLNPLVTRASKSSAVEILDVACLLKQSLASSSLIPFPLSTTWIKVRPASTTTTAISEAPASTQFSITSLTTEAGRPTTSPAAIWFATCSESWTILPIIPYKF